jgi:uncharacterized protein involved in exopolysaccharide biosynthesis
MTVTEQATLQGDELSVVALLRTVWRYKYFIGVVIIVCLSIAVFEALTTAPVYRAEVLVVPATDSSSGSLGGLASQFGGLASLAGINLPKGENDVQAMAVLNSRYLVQEFIRHNDLVNQVVRSGKRTLWFAVGKFRDTILSIKEKKEAQTTTIAIEWGDPVVAAQWANGIVALANKLMRDTSLQESAKNIKYLNEQLAKTEMVELRRVLYSLIENETKRQMLASGREQYAFRVVDPAVAPEQRIWPRRTLMALTGIFAGILLGTLLALGHDAWRRHMKV